MHDKITQKFKSYEFVKLIQNEKILDDIAHKIYERNPKKIKDFASLKSALKYSDKELF